MPLSPLQILVYSVVLTGASIPAECNLSTDGKVTCSNGVTAIEDAKGEPLLNGTIQVKPSRDGKLVFSNGIIGAFTSFGWVHFTNGIELRRDDLHNRLDAWLVAPNLFCETVSDSKAVCRRE